MATIHHTTLVPSKLELLTGWLPGQPWYRGTGGQPDLAKIGGFRLDDPAGEVGIEFMFIIDRSDGRGVRYQVPMTYRSAPLAGAEAALIGTAEHGVLGTRWLYDGAADPVLVAQLLAGIQGTAAAQHSSRSDTPEPTVVGRQAEQTYLVVAGDVEARTENGHTVIEVAVRTADGERAARIDLPRVLGQLQDPISDVVGYLEAEWTDDEGGTVRGPIAFLQVAQGDERVRDPYDESNTDTFADDPD